MNIANETVTKINGESCQPVFSRAGLVFYESHDTNKTFVVLSREVIAVAVDSSVVKYVADPDQEEQMV